MKTNFDSRRSLALAVESAVFQALLNAEREPERESYWRSQADRLDQKFTNEFGMHYARVLYG